MKCCAYAPVNILDVGGWTDTAYAEHGMMLTWALNGGATIDLTPAMQGGINLQVDETATGMERMAIRDTVPILRTLAREFGVVHMQALAHVNVPVGHGLDVHAALTVAFAAGMARMTGRSCTPLHLAWLAHAHYLEGTGYSCGMHGFLAAAFGGIGMYRFDPYPRAFHVAVPVPPTILAQLEASLLLVYTRQHQCADGHRRLEARLHGEPHARELHWLLRAMPGEAMAALTEGDLESLGAVLREQAEIQWQLCPGTYTPDVAHIMRIGQRHGARGGTLNGMGGSLTLLATQSTLPAVRTALHEAGYHTQPVKLERNGVRVWYEDEHVTPLAPQQISAQSQAAAPAAQVGE